MRKYELIELNEHVTKNWIASMDADQCRKFLRDTIYKIAGNEDEIALWEDNADRSIDNSLDRNIKDNRFKWFAKTNKEGYDAFNAIQRSTLAGDNYRAVTSSDLNYVGYKFDSSGGYTFEIEVRPFGALKFGDLSGRWLNITRNQVRRRFDTLPNAFKGVFLAEAIEVMLAGFPLVKSRYSSFDRWKDGHGENTLKYAKLEEFETHAHEMFYTQGAKKLPEWLFEAIKYLKPCSISNRNGCLKFQLYPDGETYYIYEPKVKNEPTKRLSGQIRNDEDIPLYSFFIMPAKANRHNRHPLTDLNESQIVNIITKRFYALMIMSEFFLGEYIEASPFDQNNKKMQAMFAEYLRDKTIEVTK